MNKFKKIFERLAMTNDRSIIWNQFLDYCIDVNLLNSKERHLDFKGNEKHYMDMLEEWLKQLNEDLETKPYSDRLGMFYEELVTSHVKSKNLGQFYTPSDVSNLMADLIINENSTGMVNDCCCGSARLVDLKEKVLANGFDWFVTDEVLAEKTRNDAKDYYKKAKNKTGIYRVSKHKNKSTNQGFDWRYTYFDGKGKPKYLSSISLDKLRDNVLAKGLEWIVFDEEIKEVDDL